MKIYYENLGLYEDDLIIYCNEIIELLQSKNITLAVANAILEKTQKILEERAKQIKLNSFN